MAKIEPGCRALIVASSNDPRIGADGRKFIGERVTVLYPVSFEEAFRYVGTAAILGQFWIFDFNGRKGISLEKYLMPLPPDDELKQMYGEREREKPLERA